MKKFFQSIGFLIAILFIWGCAGCVNQTSPERVQTSTSMASPTQTTQPTLAPIPFEELSVEGFVELQRIHQDKISCFAHSPDGTLLAVARNSGIYIYDVSKMSYVKHWMTDRLVIELSWASDNTFLASRQSDDAIVIWNVKDEEKIETIDLSIISPAPSSLTISAPISWSPDGTQFFAFGVIWNTKNWEPEFTVEGTVSGVLWSPRNNIISTNHYVGWGAWTKKGEPLIHHIGTVFNVAWSPNGELIAMELMDSNGKCIYVWDPAIGESVYQECFSESIKNISWTSDGLYLAFSIANGMKDDIKILNISTGKIEKEFSIPICSKHQHSSENVMIWSPSGTQIVTGHDDGFIKVWDVKTGQLEKEFQAHSSDVDTIKWVIDQPTTIVTSGAAIVSGRINSGVENIRIWDISTGKMLEDISSNIFVPQITWSSDNTSVMAGTNKMASIWNVNTGHLEQDVYYYGDSVNLISWSPDGETIAYSEAASNKILTWNTFQGKHEFNLGSDYYKAIAWSPTLNWLAVSGYPELVIYVVNSEQALLHAEDGCQVVSISWSFDGKLIAYGDRCGKTSIFNPATDEIIQSIEIHGGDISEIAWSPNGQFIALVDGDSNFYKRKSVQVYNVISGSIVFELDGHQIAWSPNGKWIATTKSNSIMIWNVDDPDIMYTLSGHEKTITDLKWSPDGTMIATISNDGTLRIWGSEVY